MDRVSTASGYQSVLLSLMNAESTQNVAEQQVSTGKIATDLSGYAANADALTASRSVQSRLTSYVANAQSLGDQLTTQDQALSALSTATQNAGTAVTQALATGDGATLMTALQAQFSSAVDALNVQYDGKYLFSGGANTTPPVSAKTLSDLAGGVATVFKNGQTPQVNRLDDTTTVTTGVLASTVATPLFTALNTINAYVTANGALSSPLTAAQTTFLQGVVSSMQSALSTVNNAVSQNGVVQQQVKQTQTSLTAQSATLTNALGDLTNADAAQAATNLQLAQTAVQASAQVFATLKSSNLLSILGNSLGA